LEEFTIKNNAFSLRIAKQNDWRVLLDWRNDQITRKNSLNKEIISIDTHRRYLNKIFANPDKNIFILDYDDKPVGTLKEDRLDRGEFELSYTISPAYRGKKISQIMMNLYLIERKGFFICQVLEDNLPSIKMIEGCGFKYKKTENKINFYTLRQN
jgi:RimJ/RimL family protein N-acetyltransferase